jgi:hypothetical protein
MIIGVASLSLHKAEFTSFVFCYAGIAATLAALLEVAI